MADVDTTKNKNDYISDLVDCQAKNNELKQKLLGLSKGLDFVFQIPIISIVLLIFSSST